MYFLPPILILVAIYGVKLAGDGFHVSAAAITDTDTQMRLAYLREIIAHGWQDGYFWRDNTPYGVVLQWTKPFYGIVLALYEAFRTVLPPERALIYAGYFTGPLLQLVTSAALYWAGRAILSRPLALVATLAVILSSGFFFYDKPGTANHHSLLLLDYVVIIGLTLRLCLAPANIALALALGLVLGFAVWTSFEMLVLAGAVFAFLFYLWVIDGKAQPVLAVATGYGFVSLLSLLLDPPYGGRSVLALDHPGLPQLGLAVLPVLLALMAQYLPKPRTRPLPVGEAEILRAQPLGYRVRGSDAGSPSPDSLNHSAKTITSPTGRGKGASGIYRLAFTLIGSLLTLGLWAWLFFVHWAGLIQRVDPMVASEMHPTIAEMGPVSHLWLTLIILGNGIIGLAVAILFLPRNRYFFSLTAFLVVLGIAATLHLRFAEYFWVAGSFVAAWCLDHIPLPVGEAERLSAQRLDASPKGRGLIFQSIACAFLIFGCQAIGFKLHGHASIEAAAELEKNCLVSDVAPALNDAAWLRGGETPVFANDFQLTPGLLFFTKARTLAGYYHRDVPGVGDSFLLFRGSDSTARNMAALHDVGFVLVCPGMGESTFGTPSLALFYKFGERRYGEQPNLYNHLEAGTPPPWLIPRPWPTGIKTRLLLYQVK